MPDEREHRVSNRVPHLKVTSSRYRARPPYYPPRPVLETGLGPLVLPVAALVAWCAIGVGLLSATLPLWAAVLIAVPVAAVLLALFIGQAGNTVMEINITAGIALILALIMWPVLAHAREHRHHAKSETAQTQTHQRPAP